MARKKAGIITCKVDASLLEAMRGIPNRSRFIRDAIAAALDGSCPLCAGTGVLSPNQQEHWRALQATHTVAECRSCHEMRLVCAERSARKASRRKAKAGKSAR